jgi:hypothetical protein
MNSSQKQAAKSFIKEWSEKGYEKGETQRFWLSLLHNIFGIDDPTKIMEFEIPVKTFAKDKGSDFIDGYITSTNVLIEQKGSHVDLSARSKQSDGTELTPYQQGLRYASGLGVDKYPRWIVACNFKTFEVHDMKNPNEEPQIVHLKDLEKEIHRLSFLVDDTKIHINKELEVSRQASEIIGVIYDKLLAQYRDPNNPESQKALNKLCVRLVFCLYAEDAGIFGTKNMFHDYMDRFPASMFREQLIKLFHILDQKPEDRDPYEDEELLAFPYANGGMFSGDIEIPRITDEIRSLILQRASDDFDWSLISPTIFGAMFESTLNPETRRAGGMHYTSIENIHKVIDPLFLNDLKDELEQIKQIKVDKTRKQKAQEFQNKLSRLTFLDPACGSGNFLTESYTSLRRLENEALKLIYGKDRVMGDLVNPIKVTINQFYGIEINDFACAVAQTALWIAESQMMQETEEIVGFNLDPLPLKAYTNIHEGNALLIDWNNVITSSQLNFIMGNPPFAGKKEASKIQKDELFNVFDRGAKGIGNLDYVCGWYIKAAKFIEGNPIRCAFVSTNSISQGEQVPILWKELLKYSIKIDFAYRTFKWSSEASEVALVYCVIIGFSNIGSSNKLLYQNEIATKCENINPYLVDAPTTLIVSRSRPICNVPQMSYGSMPIDNGSLILTEEDRNQAISESMDIEHFIYKYVGGDEIIHNNYRWCLWLKGASPKILGASHLVKSRIIATRDFRLSSNRPQTKALAETPSLFGEIRQPNSRMIVVPKVTAGTRRYIPLIILEPTTIVNGSALVIPCDDLYLFGVLHSSVHMNWVRAVCCYYGPSYQYSATGIYNNFPWPQAVSDAQKRNIEQTAKAILDARDLYPESSLADLYDQITMPPELRKAHRANDAAVLEAYGFPKDISESEIVAHLFKMYQKMTEKET